MSIQFVSTDSYKGVRDFYPEDAAIQHYIFNTWSKTAESFGFERYDASIFEPAELYLQKNAENEEMVNEQTYTFTDRGDRRVTLRPEMTPTVARMVAKKRRDLTFPLRWYSIPNLFRYERPQRGRLREHWQLNCDIFGAHHQAADVEVIALAYQLLIDFGATPDMFEIRINDRSLMQRIYRALGVTNEMIPAITHLNDRRKKISEEEYRSELTSITHDEVLSEEIIMMIDHSDEQSDVVLALAELGITNTTFDRSIARGFNYYTGTIFEIFDTASENNRALLGGGRYDNLTEMFGDEVICGIGFGMGDVTMRDFLETHNLLPTNVRANSAKLFILPYDETYLPEAQKIAQTIRAHGHNVATDLSSKKLSKKITDANKRSVPYILVVGENERTSEQFVLKELNSGKETLCSIAELVKLLR